MMNRCILIFTKFDNIEKIDELRKKYDPAVNNIAPHITLVFPFESNIDGTSLREHIEKNVKGIKPFKVELQGISGENKNYLFLNVIKGKEKLTELHNKLYTGILEEFKPEFLNTIKFKPHLTVGKLDNDEEFVKAIEDTEDFNEVFKIMVERITVEIIGEKQEAIIESEIDLG